jgi:hypothetical protein
MTFCSLGRLIFDAFRLGAETSNPTGYPRDVRGDLKENLVPGGIAGLPCLLGDTDTEAWPCKLEVGRGDTDLTPQKYLVKRSEKLTGEWTERQTSKGLENWIRTRISDLKKRGTGGDWHYIGKRGRYF